MNPVILRRVSWALMALVFVGALVFGSIDDQGTASAAERSANLARGIACPVCDGESVAESNAPIAEVIRTEIKQQVDSGLSDAQIRQVYMDEYGEWVNLEPAGDGFTSLVWIVPFLVIGAATGALALAFARWKPRAATREVTDRERNLVAAARRAAAGGAATAADADADDAAPEPDNPTDRT